MIVDALLVDPATFEHLTGWEVKPEGLCQGDVCMPVPERSDGLVDVADFAERRRMPVVHDDRHALWAAGPEGGGRFLASATCPEIVLPDLDGNPFALSSLHGQKVLLIAWASW